MLDATALDVLFNEARTFTWWQDRPVSPELLQQVYDLARMGPTSANACPARFVFLHSASSRERLRPALSEGNVRQTMSAPVTVIVAHDMEFYEQLPRLYPHTDARSWFAGKEDAVKTTAFRNGTLQGAYLMLAARALGLDCGPMSGFDNARVDAEFFADTRWKSNFLINMGYGDRSHLRPRNPRLPFEDACRLL